MTLCPECVTTANATLLKDRIANRGIPKDEDREWARNYNRAHKLHTRPAPKTKKKAKV